MRILRLDRPRGQSSSVKLFALVPLLSLCLFGLGCDRNIAPYVPGEEPQQPDLSRIFPAPEAEAPQGGGPPGVGGEPIASQPAGRSGASVRGTVQHPDAEPEVGSAVLFLIARPVGAVGGPPLAVVRIAEPSFPVDFEIGPGDVMIPTMRFEGAIALTARLDEDGNATTRSEADRATSAPVPVTPGDVGVELRLR